jgi:hypothetical protein
VAYCTNCGAEIHGKFCARCGKSIDASSAAERAAQKAPVAPTQLKIAQAEDRGLDILFWMKAIPNLIFLFLAPSAFGSPSFPSSTALIAILLYIMWIALYYIAVRGTKNGHLRPRAWLQVMLIIDFLSVFGIFSHVDLLWSLAALMTVVGSIYGFVILSRLRAVRTT